MNWLPGIFLLYLGIFIGWFLCALLGAAKSADQAQLEHGRLFIEPRDD